MDFGDIIGAVFPRLHESLNLRIVLLLIKIGAAHTGSVKSGLQESVFTGIPAFFLIVVSLIESKFGFFVQRAFICRIAASGFVLNPKHSENVIALIAIFTFGVKVIVLKGEFLAEFFFKDGNHTFVIAVAEGTVVGVNLD